MTQPNCTPERRAGCRSSVRGYAAAAGQRSSWGQQIAEAAAHERSRPTLTSSCRRRLHAAERRPAPARGPWRPAHRRDPPRTSPPLQEQKQKVMLTHLQENLAYKRCAGPLERAVLGSQHISAVHLKPLQPCRSRRKRHMACCVRHERCNSLFAVPCPWRPAHRRGLPQTSPPLTSRDQIRNPRHRLSDPDVMPAGFSAMTLAASTLARSTSNQSTPATAKRAGSGASHAIKASRMCRTRSNDFPEQPACARGPPQTSDDCAKRRSSFVLANTSALADVCLGTRGAERMH